MIRSVLIANRGEIARRIIRTAKRMGVRTISVFSDADAAAAHVSEADAAARLGPPPSRESYLRAEAILAVAKETGAEAIHPGYGFLAENAEFAEAVIASGIVWIGPPPSAIRAMGMKDAAKRLMRDAGVPITPGYLGDEQDTGRLAAEAASIGWPVLIKAVAGGGGKGMRKVDEASAFNEALAAARREAAAAFGDDRVLLEKFVSRPRHIEVQVFADAHGSAVHLFERDCSLQRRHQKVIEEAPAPGMSESTRQALCGSAVRAARAVGYVGAGTVEFIADASAGLAAERIWFMEMNTRLQVEHPVTEAITGVDLVEWQFRVASGERLPLEQSQVVMRGHAIEARLYAEDPAKGFLPSTGRLAQFEIPAGPRIDSAVRPGDTVGPHYDPMLAKIIVHNSDRSAAAAGLARACEETRVWPVRSNAWFLARCLNDPDFVAGNIDTAFIETRSGELTRPPRPSTGAVTSALAAILDFQSKGCSGPWARPLAFFRLNSEGSGSTPIYSADVALTATLTEVTGTLKARFEDGTQFARVIGTGEYAVDDRLFRVEVVGDGEAVVFEAGAAFEIRNLRPGGSIGAEAVDGDIRSPMPGRVVAIARQSGESVTVGETLVTLEAMKMEHALKAPFSGHVSEIAVKVGEQVAENTLLVRLGGRADSDARS